MSYKEQAISLGIKVDGRWSEKRIKAEVGRYSCSTDEVMAAVDEISDPPRICDMNDLARRMFEGQGSLPDIERVRIITEALSNKGYSTDEIQQLDIPIENLSNYLG